MKKLTLTLLILIPLELFAPTEKVIYIEAYKGISFYDPLVKAITWVESKDGLYTYNEKEQAVGWFQIRPVRVEHYNKLKGTNYKHEDFYDYDLSKEMFLFFAKGKSYEQAARRWNGSGRITREYWEKVNKALQPGH